MSKVLKKADTDILKRNYQPRRNKNEILRVYSSMNGRNSQGNYATSYLGTVWKLFLSDI